MLALGRVVPNDGDVPLVPHLSDGIAGLLHVRAVGAMLEPCSVGQWAALGAALEVFLQAS